MIFKRICLGLILLFIQNIELMAINDSTSHFKLSSYIEFYYQYRNPNNGSKELPSYVNSFKKLNQFNLNIGLLKASYERNKFRSNLGIMTGNYGQANLAHEPAPLRHLFEANIGFKLLKNNNLWLDFGLIPSHIGFESALSIDCWHLTRSIMADNTPYYEMGFKLNHTSKNEHWISSLFVLNGWQQMNQLEIHKTPVLGHQIIYQPDSSLKINSSSFIGHVNKELASGMRYYHNFYIQKQFTNKMSMIAAFDIGRQTISSNHFIWYSPALGYLYQPTNRKKIALRLEYFYDPNTIVILPATNHFEAIGASVNYDYKINKYMNIRNEFKWLKHSQNTFTFCSALIIKPF
jgi:hypothetical protein